MRRSIALPLLLAIACAAEAPPGPDAGSDSPDAGGTTDAVDAGAPALVLVTPDGGRFAFEEAGAGITFGTETTPDELYAESWSGGFTGCPSEASPTPDRILIFSGISLGSDAPAVQTYESGARLVMLDFKGDVTSEPGPQRATAVSISALTVEGCPDAGGDCAGPFAFEVAATVPQGTVSGRVVAGRCASLDE